MMASFIISSQTLKELISISNNNIFLKLLNNEIRFIELEVGRQTVGLLKTLENYKLSDEINNLPIMNIKRSISITKKSLYNFSRRVIGNKVEIEITNLVIRLFDINDKRRTTEIRLNSISKFFDDPKKLNNYHKRSDFVVIDDIVFTQLMITIGNYILISAKERVYKNNKIPANEIRWQFEIKSQEVDMVERRLDKVGNYSDDVWNLNIIKEQLQKNVNRPNKLVNYFRAVNIQKYTDISGTNKIILAFTNTHSMVVFLIKHNDYITAISGLKPNIPELFNN